MPKLPKTKQDYSLSYRVKEKSGQWSQWRIAFGEWIGIEHVQNQIKMLLKAYQRDIEIKFEKDGVLLDQKGEQINRAMIFEKR